MNPIQQLREELQASADAAKIPRARRIAEALARAGAAGIALCVYHEIACYHASLPFPKFRYLSDEDLATSDALTDALERLGVRGLSDELDDFATRKLLVSIIYTT